ncbi:MAG TPA: EVE domain-containing protein [Pirellulales bacterium]|jgi:predicted RNA-binding protein with PUA-like domain|nr:EVE domain-containing protein [Pirellulales bacterium]
MPKSKARWLVKSEPDCFSIHDLAAQPSKTTCWDGVRNYLARNHMRAMELGDEVLFYHSNADPLAIVGAATVARTAYPDPTAWDSASDHFDSKASPANPIWDMVDLRLKAIFAQPIPLETLRAEPRLAKMELLRRGSRLSVQPVSEDEYRVILELGHAKATSHDGGPTAKHKLVRREKRARPAAVKKKRNRA